MHGLVLVDKDQHVLRNSIIWCDSRAVEIGNKAFHAIGEETMFITFAEFTRKFYRKQTGMGKRK